MLNANYFERHPVGPSEDDRESSVLQSALS